jgi:hypothetical protein
MCAYEQTYTFYIHIYIYCWYFYVIRTTLLSYSRFIWIRDCRSAEVLIAGDGCTYRDENISYCYWNDRFRAMCVHGIVALGYIIYQCKILLQIVGGTNAFDILSIWKSKIVDQKRCVMFLFQLLVYCSWQNVTDHKVA